MRMVRRVMHVDSLKQQLNLRWGQRQNSRAIFHGSAFRNRERSLF